MPVFDYAAERLAIINKGVMYVPPHHIGLVNPCAAAGVKFLTPHGSYAWVWRLDDIDVVDTQKDKQIGIAEVMRVRLLGRFGWLWRCLFMLLSKIRLFTWWLYRGRSN